MQAKHIISDFEGFFEGLKFVDPQIVLSADKGNFWGEKSFASI
jgi:hypothetical protein